MQSMIRSLTFVLWPPRHMPKFCSLCFLMFCHFLIVLFSLMTYICRDSIYTQRDWEGWRRNRHYYVMLASMQSIFFRLFLFLRLSSLLEVYFKNTLTFFKGTWDKLTTFLWCSIRQGFWFISLLFFSAFVYVAISLLDFQNRYWFFFILPFLASILWPFFRFHLENVFRCLQWRTCSDEYNPDYFDALYLAGSWNSLLFSACFFFLKWNLLIIQVDSAVFFFFIKIFAWSMCKLFSSQ